MYARSILKSRLSCFFMLVLILCTVRAATAAGSLAATVIAERGNASVQHAGLTKAAALGLQDALYSGDIVRVSAYSQIEILFIDGSQIKVGANSVVKIYPDRGASRSANLFSAIIGTIWAHVRPESKIDTPSANVVVRGTEIALTIADDGTTQLNVVSGEATFFNTFGSVDLVENQQSIARPGEAPTPPITVDPTGLIAWTANVVSLPLVYETPRIDAMTVSPNASVAVANALLLTPTDPDGWDTVGDARRALGDTVAAEAAYNRAITISPTDLNSHLGLALTALSENRVDNARAALAQVAAQPSAQAVAGLIDLQTGDAAGAIAHLTPSVVADPTNASAFSLLALAQLQLGQSPADQISANKAVALAPNSAVSLGALSVVLFFDGKNREATGIAKRALKADPFSPLALLASGRAAVVGGNLELARTNYEKALAFAPNLWILHEELGAVYVQLKSPRKAGEEFAIALSINPQSADAEAGQAVVEQQSGNYVKAQKDFDTAVALDPSNASVRYYYASFLVDRGNLDAAEIQIKAVTGGDTKFGLIYARLAEISLYKQEVYKALGYAQQGVKLLPDSAIAHYELGRVYLEEQHTYQAEEEFRLATVLDPQLATARYALGLVEEKTQQGLVQSFSSIFNSDIVGSPASSASLNNTQTPGANDRILAAMTDPTSVVAATRSYGTSELDGDIGTLESHDVAASYLTDTDGGNGVVGLSAETQFNHGVRHSDDSTTYNASAIVGKKAVNDATGYTVLSDYEQENIAANSGDTSSTLSAIERSLYRFSRIDAGTSTSLGSFGHVTTLLQGIDDTINIRSGEPATTLFYAPNNTRDDSIDAELRWDGRYSPTNQLVAGVSYGNRRRNINSLINFGSLPLDTLNGRLAIAPLQAYFRDNVNTGKLWSAVAQLKYVQEYPFGSSSWGASDFAPDAFDHNAKNVVLPYLILAYRSDNSSLFRLRYQQVAASNTDFSLLMPSDDFLIDYSDFPQPDIAGTDEINTATQTDFEFDKTLKNASFFSLGVFRQYEKANSSDGLTIFLPVSASIQGIQSSYQGAVNKYVTFLLLGEFSNAEDTSIPQRLSNTPNFSGIGVLQYLDKAGVYCQIAEYYQGSEVTSPPTELGGLGVLNVRVGKRFGLRSNVYIQVTNALDKQYDINGTAQQGTEVLLGASQRY